MLLDSDIYIIKKIIGKGSFGTVYWVYDKKLNRDIACKVENISDGKLKYEYNLYNFLRENKMTFIPEIYGYIKTEDKHIMSMELMGKSLDKIFNKNNKKMDISTLLKIAINCIDIMEQLHNCGIIHRDIKPHNFVIDRNKEDKLYIIDFGLAKKYYDMNKIHIGLKTDRDIIGTLKYISINIHLGLEPSRRDDLESIGYMLVYLAKGILPWENINNDNIARDVEIAKLCITSGKLCSDLPKCFEEYVEYSRNLKFKEIPDYDKLKNLFINYAKTMNIEPKFFWQKID